MPFLPVLLAHTPPYKNDVLGMSSENVGRNISARLTSRMLLKGKFDSQEEFYDLVNSDGDVLNYLKLRYKYSDVPSHIVMFDSLEPKVSGFLEEFNFKRVCRLVYTFWLKFVSGGFFLLRASGRWKEEQLCLHFRTKMIEEASSPLFIYCYKLHRFT